jgi:uncharacterized integral membrane protein
LADVVDPAHLTRAQTDAVNRSRRGRNWAMLVTLVLIALLFYALAFVKLGHR